MLSFRRLRKLRFDIRSPYAWVFIASLVLANIATLWVLWSLIGGQGIASEGLSLPNPGRSISLLLPESTSAPEPTATATQVFIFLPTPTKTPTPLPTPSPTETGVPTPAPVSIPTQAPVRPKFEHVVIFSIDGLRPDALALADTPALDNLKTNGAYSPNAKAVLPSNTMPNHASMLSGMIPDKHGILWNLPTSESPRVNGPTLFSVAHEAGFTTAMVVGKTKLEYLVLPNSVDQFIGSDTSDITVKNQALQVIRAGLPNILFIHFPDVDNVGHDAGWMSPGQLQTVTIVDGLISEIVTTLREADYLDRTLLIVTADHGGNGTGHGQGLPIDTTIPWLAVGPDVPAGYILTGPIMIYDTAATALTALGVPIPATWDGRPVQEIFN
ncbi:MAG TPA: alkaline phosphatase family protein [Anaerolineae bacterium]|jgi:hypothetical protein